MIKYVIILILFFPTFTFASEQFFNKNVLPLLNRDCGKCHDNPASDYNTAKSLIVSGNPAKSRLYNKAAGQKSHRTIWDIDSLELKILRQWIQNE